MFSKIKVRSGWSCIIEEAPGQRSGPLRMVTKVQPQAVCEEASHTEERILSYKLLGTPRNKNACLILGLKGGASCQELLFQDT